VGAGHRLRLTSSASSAVVRDVILDCQLTILIEPAALSGLQRWWPEPVFRLGRYWLSSDLRVRTGLRRGIGELGRLGEEFDRVVGELQKREEALKDSEERTRLAVEAGRMGTWWFDVRRQAGGWSEPAARMFGLPTRRPKRPTRNGGGSFILMTAPH
jgi:PAS domain-containing protein